MAFGVSVWMVASKHETADNGDSSTRAAFM